MAQRLNDICHQVAGGQKYIAELNLTVELLLRRCVSWTGFGFIFATERRQLEKLANLCRR